MATPADPLRGILWMLLSAACLTGVSAVAHYQAAHGHPFVFAFVRSLVIVAIMVAWKPRLIRLANRRRFGLYLLRATVGTAGMLLMFLSLALLPLAVATALTFTAPLFATAGAAVFLKETVRLRRWVATSVGFIGVMIILRPDPEVLNWGVFFALGGALLSAGVVLIVKSLSRTEDSNDIVFMGALLMVPLTALAAGPVWTMPSLEIWLWMIFGGLCAFGTQQGMTRAFAAAETSLVMPFDFTRLIFAVLVGLILFGEPLDGATVLGGMVIFASALYIAHRERRLAKSARPPNT